MCDTLCLRTGTGMVFAKNSDRPPGEAQVLFSHPARTAGPALATQYLRIADAPAHAFVASHPHWLWGAEHGVNGHGVAVGNEKIWTIDDPRAQPAGLLGMDLVRLALERARTADEARDVMTALLATHGQGGSGEHGKDRPYFSSFLVADAHGGWIIETSGRTWAARPLGDGASISNRISLTTDWSAASADVEPGTSFDRWRAPGVSTLIADHRLAVTSSCIARGRDVPAARSAAAVVATLRDHGAGPWGAPDERDPPSPLPQPSGDDGRDVTVCMHVRGKQATTASFVADLRAGVPPRAWACLGSPCASVYVPCFPPRVPAPLADPAQWHRFASLRDRVEADDDALTEVRVTLAPVEAELWAEADACFALGDPAALDAFTGGAYARVDAALTRLRV